MDEGMEEDISMDYATIQIYPIQNRYEAYVQSNTGKEKIATGLLENLLPHLPQVKDLFDKGSGASFNFNLPEELHGEEWFTRSIIERFLHLVNSPDLIITIGDMMEEMSQLEETKKFHLSLYVQGHQNHVQSGGIDGKSTTDLAPNSQPEVKVASSDASKNELLRAMDLRLTTLSKELMNTLDKAANAHISTNDVSYLVHFAQHFGATQLENFLRRYLEIIGKCQGFDLPDADKSFQKCESKVDDADNTPRDGQVFRAITPIKYGVSPAKVAEVERHSSTDSEESSCSSDEDQPSAERSRTLIRSATPRRSASPMRRVQVGRTGPRRPAAIAIKSLNLFPAKERPLLHRDINGNGIEREVSEQPKKNEIDVRRITVQDAINLFESKQRDQTTDKNGKPLTDVFINSKKSVLRRWSAGMGEGPATHLPQNISEDANSLASSDVAICEINLETKTEPGQVSEIHTDNKTVECDVKLQGQESEWSSVESRSQNDLAQVNRSSKKMTSTEWNQQKEAELNQMLMKMMETKTVKSGKHQVSKTQNLPQKQRGGFYDSYKEKRDAKLRAENSGERAEKKVQFQAMQKMLDKGKAEMAMKLANAAKTNVTRKPQKPAPNASQHENSPKEAIKTSVARKGPSKISPTTVTRKSWPSAPSPRETGLLPANVRGGMSSAGSTPTQRKSQQKPIMPQPSLRKEKPQKQQSNVKESETSGVRSLKSQNEKQKPASASKRKVSKQKDATPVGEASIQSKLIPRNKGTKKSSVVPLEQKPSVRKISGIGSAASLVNKKKDSPRLEKSHKKSESLVENEEKELVSCADDENVQHQGVDDEKLDHRDAAVEADSGGADIQQQFSESENLEQVISEDVNVLKIMGDSSAEIKAEEEPTISPSAWVEIEEHEEISKPHSTGASQPSYLADIAPVGAASPRVRHSLSQMLQEETSEPDICEWGNAENPPTILYQKDAPKGLKRLLKFARKSKGDANSSGWSSPSVFSEGEEDTEESKISRRNAAFGTKNHGQQKSSLLEGYGKHIAQSNLSKFDGHNSHKMQDAYDGVAGSTNKGTRFFSLSAFRGKQTN